jgi:hypothetical protein
MQDGRMVKEEVEGKENQEKGEREVRVLVGRVRDVNRNEQRT